MEKIEIYQTEDGRRFDTEDEAKSYIADKICEVLDKHLRGIHKKHPQFNVCHIVDIVRYMAEDYDRAITLIEELNKVRE